MRLQYIHPLHGLIDESVPPGFKEQSLRNGFWVTDSGVIFPADMELSRHWIAGSAIRNLYDELAQV